MSATKKTSNSNQPKDKKPLHSSQSKILKNLADRLSEDYTVKHDYSTHEDLHEDDPQVQKINRLITRSVSKISNEEEEKTERVKEKNDKNFVSPDKFDGLNGLSETKKLLLEELRQAQKENSKLKHQVSILKKDFETEKNDLKKSVRALKNELHRTSPIQDNKFFSFSKNLRDVVDTVNSLTENDFSVDLKNETEGSYAPEPLTLSSSEEKIDKKPEEELPQPPVPTKEEEKETKSIKKEPPQKTKPKSRKKIAIAGVAVIIVVLAGVALLLRRPSVDPTLVNSYLNNPDGEVQGATSETGETGKKKENKFNDVSFEDTQWEMFRDEFLGFQVRHPTNVTDLLHTGNTITFLRKDGYLFKMQRIQTSETLSDYWERVQQDGLAFKKEETTLTGKPALHLVLEEEIEFPGNRYLLEHKGYIYDLWYSTASEKFSEDDMKRVGVMVETARFL